MRRCRCGQEHEWMRDLELDASRERRKERITTVIFLVGFAGLGVLLSKLIQWFA